MESKAKDGKARQAKKLNLAESRVQGNIIE
jgi:hypothetical protein